MFFQAEDGIRDLVRSRGLGDVYKRQPEGTVLYGDVFKVVVTKDGVEVIDVPTDVCYAYPLSLIHI